jgi:hypothetical protein
MSTITEPLLSNLSVDELIRVIELDTNAPSYVRALVDHIEDLQNQLSAANTECDRVDNENCELQSEVGVLTNELSEAKAFSDTIAEAAADYKQAVGNSGFAEEHGGIDALRLELFKQVDVWHGDTDDDDDADS